MLFLYWLPIEIQLDATSVERFPTQTAKSHSRKQVIENNQHRLRGHKNKATDLKMPRIPTMDEISQISGRTWVWDFPLPTEEWLLPLWCSCYKYICTYNREPKSQFRLSHSFTRTRPQMHTPIQYTHKCTQSPGLLWEAQTHLTADCHKATLQPGAVWYGLY